MRALSLLQPWASLVALGVKRVETRSWRRTVFPDERIAIHASRGKVATSLEEALLEIVAQGSDVDLRGSAMPRGVIVATCRVAFIEATRQQPSDRLLAHIMRERVGGVFLERELGDWSPNRFLWALDDVRLVVPPIPCRGSLSLWTVPADVAARIS